MIRFFSALLATILITASLQAATLPGYVSPFEIRLTNSIGSWTSDFATRSGTITNNSFPSTSNWYSFDYNASYPGGYGPLDPELFTTSSENTSNTNIIAALRYDRGPGTFDVPINEAPQGVAPLLWMQQRLLAAASGLIGTHYQHIHLPEFNPSNVLPATNYTWSPVSDNQYLQTSQELLQKTNSGITNPYAAIYGSPQPGIDCTDFASYIYNLALGIQMYSGTATQVQFINADTNSSLVTNSFLSSNSIPTATILAKDGSVITPNFLPSPNFGTPSINLPGSLSNIISQLRPGDLLYMRGTSTNISHVVVWLGNYGVMKNGKPSTVPLIISSHDNTPAIFNTTNIDSVTGLPAKLTSNDITTFLPPPGVQILPFTPDTWFYQSFSVAMQVLPLPYPSNFSVSKIINYDQSGPSAPTRDPYQPYQFQCNVNPLTNADLLPTSQLLCPAGSTGNVTLETGENGLSFSQNFASQAALNTAFPNGGYNFVLQTTEPNTYFDTLTLGNSVYPAVPKITKLTNAFWTNDYLMVSNPSLPVTLNWGTFKATNGSISFSIQGNDNFNGFYTNFPALGSQNGFTIPIGTLPTNSVLQGTISFDLNPGGDDHLLYQVQNSFFLLSGPIPPASNPYVIQKQHVLLQSSTNVPADGSGSLNGNYAPYNFSIQTPTSGTVTGPGGKYALSFTTQQGGGVSYGYLSAPIATLAKLNATYKDGAYKSSTHPTLQLTNSIYPNSANPPQITLVNGEPPTWNTQGELVLDPTINNTLTWTPYSVTNTGFSFTTAGYEQFQIQNSNGGYSTNQSAGPFAGGGGAFNQLTIPAGSLLPNQTFSRERSTGTAPRPPPP